MQIWGPFSYCIAGECAQSEENSLSLLISTAALLKSIGVQWVKAVAEICLQFFRLPGTNRSGAFCFIFTKESCDSQ